MSRGSKAGKVQDAPEVPARLLSRKEFIEALGLSLGVAAGEVAAKPVIAAKPAVRRF